MGHGYGGVIGGLYRVIHVRSLTFWRFSTFFLSTSHNHRNYTIFIVIKAQSCCKTPNFMLCVVGNEKFSQFLHEISLDNLRPFYHPHPRQVELQIGIYIKILTCTSKSIAFSFLSKHLF
jgi:hypothetical protein